MGKKKREGKLFITIAGIIAIIMIFLNLCETFIVAGHTEKQVTELSTERYVDVSNGYASNISQILDEYFAHLDYYVNHDVVQTQDTNIIVQWLRAHESLRFKDFDYVAWVDKNADFYSDIGTQTNIKDRDYFQAIMQQGKDIFIDNPVSSKTSGQTIVHISRAAKVNGKTVGFFCAVVNINHLSVLLDDVNMGNNGIAMLVSGDGQTIAKVGAKDMIDLDIDVSKYTDSSVINTEFLSNLNGAGQVYNIVRPISNTKWSTVFLIKESAITAISTGIGRYITGFSILLAVLVVMVIAIVVYISTKPLAVLEKAIKEIATGNADLTKRIDIKANNEIGRVVQGFNQFSEKLQDIVSSIKETKEGLVTAGQNLNQSTSDTAAAITEIIANIDSMGNSISSQSNSVNQTAGAVNQIASNIESLNNMIESQSASVTQASAAVEEMIGNINSVSNSVDRMAVQFKDLEEKSIAGLQLQDEVSNKMELIESESEALQEANTVIANIAEQTNLLAMNAAIEAAHAGEAGKGFSVVADEIRKLSENSTSQSNSIGAQLKKIIDSISEMVAASEEAKQSFSAVSAGINETNSLVQEISGSMAEQQEGSRQISEALSAMNDSTSEVRSASMEMAEGNKSILAEIQNLQDATFTMKSGMDEMSVGATQINRTGSELSNISDQMDVSIKTIGEEVDKFKV